MPRGKRVAWGAWTRPLLLLTLLDPTSCIVDCYIANRQLDTTRNRMPLTRMPSDRKNTPAFSANSQCSSKHLISARTDAPVLAVTRLRGPLMQGRDKADGICDDTPHVCPPLVAILS